MHLQKTPRSASTPPEEPSLEQVVVHLSPHPDDETLGCGATLASLRDTGWTIVNIACSLGHPEDHDRRRAELAEATRRLGIENQVVEPPTHLDDGAVFDVLAGQVEAVLRELRPSILVSPQPHDAHPHHELVGRVAMESMAKLASPPAWWMWGLWADLPMPTVYVPYGEERLAELMHVLSAYGGEIARNDYARLLPARATSQAVLGAERVFGFGSETAHPDPYADLLTEAHRVKDTWLLGTPRILDSAQPHAEPGVEPLTWWLTAPSVTELHSNPRVARR